MQPLRESGFVNRGNVAIRNVSKRKKDRRVTVLVASSVYGYEGLLEQVFAVLSAYGFKVLMSHKGTIPLDPNRTALQNCLQAVRNCDVFLGIITGRYGSGRVKNALSITHREILEAIKLAKDHLIDILKA